MIFENDQAYSILNYKPSVPGHTLIIPRQHIVDLKELTGSVLENYIQAIPLTFETLSIIISEEPQRIRSYYLSIVQEPPEPQAKIYAQQMLTHPFLSVKPTSYNWGMNVGFKAGQREGHIHIHLFPRRGNGLGIATAMRKYHDLK